MSKACQVYYIAFLRYYIGNIGISNVSERHPASRLTAGGGVSHEVNYNLLYSSHNDFRIKSEIKLSGDTFTKIWLPACQPLASPTCILVGTGKTEDQIGFSIRFSWQPRRVLIYFRDPYSFQLSFMLLLPINCVVYENGCGDG